MASSRGTSNERRDDRVALRLLIALALALLYLLAPHGASAGDNQQILRRGNGAEPATLDPAKSEAVTDAHIADDLFEGLVELGADNRVVPAAAKSWTISPDGLIYTFTLWPTLKWSNGARLTAADFVYSFRRAVDSATGSKYGFLYSPVKNADAIVDGTQKDVTALGVRAVDETTLEITLNAPTGYFLTLLPHHTFFPVNQANIERDGAHFTRPGKLISNGPFMLSEWVPQSRLVAIKNPYFHDADHVKLTEVQYFPIENENEEYKRYRAGELDLTDNVPVDQMDMIRREIPNEFIAPLYFGLYYIGFNCTRPPFKDAPGLRNALSMVIDRDNIVHDITRRGEPAAFSWIPPGIPGYQSQTVDWMTWPMEQRIAEAQRLYAAAGYNSAHPLTIELRYNTSENHKKIMIAVAEMWRRALGVNVSLINEEWKVFLETRKARQVTEAYRDAWIGDYVDPNAFFQLLQADSGLNYAGYDNPAYDALIRQAAVTLDPAIRFDLFQQAERLVLHDAPVAPIYSYVNQHLVKPWVVGFHPDLLGYTYSRNISIGPGRVLGTKIDIPGLRYVGMIVGIMAVLGLVYLLVKGSPVFILKRLAGAVPTLLAIVTIAFFMIRLAPGGPFSSERAVPPEIEANLNRVYHLDQPLLLQYWHYLGNVLRGDFGPSFSYKDFSVTELIWRGFPVSMQLGLTAVFLAVVIGSVLGTLAALRQNQPADYGVMAVAMTGITVPNFVMAPLMTLILGVYLRWLPVGGWGDGSELQYKILPIAALALPQIAYVARLTRGSMIEVLRSNYIRTARAKGLSEWLTVTRHAARAALLPVVSYLGPASAGIITGSVVIEQIFSVPGIGRYFVQGALNRDYTLVMGVVIFYGVLIILFNLIVDVLYGVLDPKLAHA